MAILAGTYRPAPDRRVSIPKASGKGTRTLSIPGIIDRLVQRAIVQTVQPYLDGLLTDHCLGYQKRWELGIASPFDGRRRDGKR
jgi:retron-type reverse transcriptase